METRELAIGIDFGTTNCSVAVLRSHSQSSDQVKTFPFEFWLYTSPSCVAYIYSNKDGADTEPVPDPDPDPVTVIGGHAAQDVTQTSTGGEEAVFDIKRLVGQSFNDPRVQKYMKHWPFSLVNVDGMAAVKINQNTVLPQQILTDLLAHLRTTAQDHLKTEITKAVLALPAHFSSLQEGLVRDACADAGFQTVQLISENTAAAAYASKLCVDLDQPKQGDNCLVVVMDLGGASLDLHSKNCRMPGCGVN